MKGINDLNGRRRNRGYVETMTKEYSRKREMYSFSYSKTTVSESLDEQLGHTTIIDPEVVFNLVVEYIGDSSLLGGVHSSNIVLDDAIV